MSGFRKSHRFVLSVLLAFASALAGAYPEGYPRSGAQRVLDTVDPTTDTSGRHIGGLRVATNGTQYLVAWRTADGIRAVRLDRKLNTLTTPFQLVRIVESDRTPDPTTPGYHLGYLGDFDIAYDSDQSRFFLAVKVQSVNTTDPESNIPTRIVGGYLTSDFLATIENWVPLNEGGDIDNPSGVRAFEVKTGSTSAVNVFWNEGGAVNDIFARRSGNIRGRVINGQTSENQLLFGTDTRTLLEVADKVENNAFTFSLRDLSVGYDADQGRFLIAATLGEAVNAVESEDYYLRSHIVATAVNKDMTLPTQSTTGYIVVNLDQNADIRAHIDLDRFPGSASASYLWPYYKPEVVLGPKEGSGQRHWLITFNKKYDIDNTSGIPDGEPATFLQGIFARRVHVTASGFVNHAIDDDERFLGGSADISSVRSQAGTDRSNSGVGLWLPQIERFLVPGTTDIVYADTMSDPDGTPLMSMMPLQIFQNTMFNHPSHGVRLLTSHFDGSLFALAESTYTLILQPLELRGQNMLMTAGRTDGAGALLINGTAQVHLTVERQPADADVGIVAGYYDSGPYALRIALPPEISLALTENISGNAEDGYYIEGSALTTEVHEYDLSLQNVNSTTAHRTVNVAFALETANSRLDYDSTDDTAVIELAIEGNPAGSDPQPEPGPEPQPGPEPGPGPEPDPGTSPGDDTSNVPPENDDGANGTANKSGGGALSWLLLSLAGLAMGRRRVS